MIKKFLKFIDSILISRKINKFIKDYVFYDKEDLINHKDILSLINKIEDSRNKHDIYVEIAIFMNKSGYRFRIQTQKIKLNAFRNKFKNIIYQEIKKYKKEI